MTLEIQDQIAQPNAAALMTVFDRLAQMSVFPREDGMEHAVPMRAGEECAATAILESQDEDDPSILEEAFFEAQRRGGRFFDGFLGLVARRAVRHVQGS